VVAVFIRWEGWHLEGWSNARLHFRDAQLRKRFEKDTTAMGLATVSLVELPAHVTMTRIAPRLLDDDSPPFKYVRDQIARWIFKVKPQVITKSGRVRLRDGVAPDGREITDAGILTFHTNDRVGPPAVEVRIERVRLQPCLVCGEGKLRPTAGKKRRIAGMVIPDDLAIPTCDRCGELTLDGPTMMRIAERVRR
jgi:hypothetical protein